MRKHWNHSHSQMPWRMELGCYVMNKMACGGVAFLLLSLIVHTSGLEPSALSASAQAIHDLPERLWAYGYGLPAALVADALSDHLPWHRKHEQAALYITVGFGLFILFATSLAPAIGSTIPWTDGIAGAGVLIIYYMGRTALKQHMILQIALAFFLPLLLLAIGLQPYPQQ